MRVLGLDPGAHAGWCLLDCGPKARPRYVASGTLEVGHPEKTAKRQRRVVVDAEIVQLVEDARGLFIRNPCDLVAISRIHDVHPTGRHESRTGQSTGTAISAGLVLASGVAWALFAVAAGMGHNVTTVIEADWRKALGCQPPRGTSADAWIGRIIPARIDGWPAPMTRGMTAHVRDAAGVAEYAAVKLRSELARL